MIESTALDAILEFLPLFESEGFEFGCWHTPEGQFPWFELSEEAERFFLALSANGWVTPFDWLAWQATARQYMDAPEQLAEADAETIQKLLTTHVRADRFCEGHLASMFESGHLTAVLRRLKVIRSSMP